MKHTMFHLWTLGTELANHFKLPDLIANNVLKAAEGREFIKSNSCMYALYGEVFQVQPGQEIPNIHNYVIPLSRRDADMELPSVFTYPLQSKAQDAVDTEKKRILGMKEQEQQDQKVSELDAIDDGERGLHQELIDLSMGLETQGKALEAAEKALQEGRAKEKSDIIKAQANIKNRLQQSVVVQNQVPENIATLTKNVLAIKAAIQEKEASFVRKQQEYEAQRQAVHGKFPSLSAEDPDIVEAAQRNCQPNEYSHLGPMRKDPSAMELDEEEKGVFDSLQTLIAKRLPDMGPSSRTSAASQFTLSLRGFLPQLGQQQK